MQVRSISGRGTINTGKINWLGDAINTGEIN
jgi:hypothetical protein